MRLRKGWKYNFELMMPDGKHHKYPLTTLTEGFVWASKVINYMRVKNEDDVVIRITKVRVFLKYESPLITLRDNKR